MMSQRAPRILVVEDERSHQLIINKCLIGFYELTMAGSVAEARNLLALHPDFDLFLLDINLPDGNGFDVLNHLRQIDAYQLTPVIFLTVRDDARSKLTGFSLGGDDYVIKPAEPLELRARIDAKLRKINQFKVLSPAAEIKCGDLILDTTRQAVWVDENGGRVALELTPLEFRLLIFMAQHPSEGLTRKRILQEVWGDATHVLDRSVDSYVATLRRKLGPRGRYIKSVHGVGYKFNPGTAKAQPKAA